MHQHAAAQNIGLGTSNPRAKVHIVDGAEGTMNFPYETLVVEKSEDAKLGIYSTSPNPVNYKASAIALGYTNYLDSNGNYPSFEMQYGQWSSSGFMLRFNSLRRSVSGNYLVNDSYSNVLCIGTRGNIGINLTNGLPIAPVVPTANLHVNGTVRFQNLPAAVNGGRFLVVDAQGNISVSANSTPNRPVAATNQAILSEEALILRSEIETLKARILQLEQLIEKK
jgi:hypothetical protein